MNFGVALIRILGADEKSETIKLELWERYVSFIFHTGYTNDLLFD